MTSLSICAKAVSAAEPAAAAAAHASPPTPAAAPAPPARREPTRKETLLGMALTLSSTLAFSVMALLVHLLGHAGDDSDNSSDGEEATKGSIPSFQSATVRFLVQGLCTLLTILVSRRTKLREPYTWLGKPRSRRLMIIRGLWGAGGMSSYFWALSSISLSDATALVFVNVPLVAILAAFLLKEPYTLIDGLTTVLCMVGVVLVAQPAALFGDASGGGAGELTDDVPWVASGAFSCAVFLPAHAGINHLPPGEESATHFILRVTCLAVPWYAVLICLFGAFSSAMAYITIRQLGPDEDTLVVVLYFSIIGSIVAPTVGAFFQTFVAVSARDVAVLCAMGVLGFLGQVLLNRGMQIAPAGPATVMRYADVVFSLIFQASLLGDPPGWLKLTGCALIMTCIAGVLVRQRNRLRATPAAAAGHASDADAAGARGAAATAGSTQATGGAIDESANVFESNGASGTGAVAPTRQLVDDDAGDDQDSGDGTDAEETPLALPQQAAGSTAIASQRSRRSRSGTAVAAAADAVAALVGDGKTSSEAAVLPVV